MRVAAVTFKTATPPASLLSKRANHHEFSFANCLKNEQ
jgi:hypothetical protein